MKDYKGNFRTYTTIKASDTGDLPTEIQVLLPGDWSYNMKYPGFQITADHIRQMVTNFKAGVRKAVLIDVDHDGGKAAGWVTDLIDKGEEGLWAVVEWTVYGADLLKNKIYKLMSPEFSLEYADPETGQLQGAVFIAGSLVNRPLFKKLNAVVASEKGLTSPSGIMLVLSQETMTLEEIKTKLKDDGKKKLTVEEIKFVNDNIDQLSEDERAMFDPKQGEPKPEPGGEKKDEVQPEPEPETKPEEVKPEEVKPEPEINASENVTMKASEVEELKILAAEGKKAKEALIAKEADETIREFICNDKGGVILPKDKKAAVDLFLTFNDSQKAEFKKLMESIPARIIAGELGEDGAASGKNPLEQIEELIDAKMKANDKLDKATAQAAVRDENPELWAEYTKFKASDEFKQLNKVKKGK